MMTRECPDLHSEELYSEWLAELKSELAKSGLDVDEAMESSFEFKYAYDDRQKPSETVRDYVMYCAEFDVEPKWRPIESAPKDYSRILLWFPWAGKKLKFAPPGFHYIAIWAHTNGDDHA